MVEVWRRNRVGTVKRTMKKRVVQRLQWERETVDFFWNLELKAIVGDGEEERDMGNEEDGVSFLGLNSMEIVFGRKVLEGKVGELGTH